MKCPVCKGRRICQTCHGTGRVEWGSQASGMPRITEGAPGSSKYVPCSRCKGSGECPRCGGTGEL
jgi:RecJ-like exonuclease